MEAIAQDGTPRFTPNDIPALLLLNERALNKLARKEIAARKKSKNIWDTYIGIKNAALSFPGKSIAKLIKRYGKGRGPQFCKRVRYCERKQWFKDRLRRIEELTEERIIAADAAAEKIVEYLPDGQDMIDTAKEFVEEFVSETADYVLPVSLIVKVFKYGMDELCEC